MIMPERSDTHSPDREPIHFESLTPFREPGYEAVYEVIRRWPANAHANSRVWRAVEAFADAMNIPNFHGAITNWDGDDLSGVSGRQEHRS